MAETVDITTLVLKADATTVSAGAKEVDKLGAAAQKTGAAVDSMAKSADRLKSSAQGAANATQGSTRATEQSAAAAEQFVRSVEREAAVLGKTRAQIIEYEAAQLGLTRAQMMQVQASVRAMEAFQQQQAAMKASTQAAGLMGGAFSGLGGVILAGFGFTAVIGGLKEFIHTMADAQRELDRFRNGFSFAFGSAEAGAQQLENVRQISNKLGLEVNATANAYLRFNAASKGTTLEGAEAERVFRAVSGAATVLGMTAQDTEGTFLALEQMVSKGTVQAEELRGQLGERLPGAFQIAARAMGVTTQALGKMLQNGEVVAADFLPKFADELEKTFGDDVEKAAQSLTARTNRMSNSWTLLKQTLADSGIGEAIGTEMGKITEGIDGITAALQRAKEEGKGLFGQLLAGAGAARNFLDPFAASTTPKAYLNLLQGQQAKALEDMGKLVDQYVANMDKGNKGLALSMKPTIDALKQEITERQKVIDKMKEQLKLADDKKAGRSGLPRSADDEREADAAMFTSQQQAAMKYLAQFTPDADKFAAAKKKLTDYLHLGLITKAEFDKALAEADKSLNKEFNDAAAEREKNIEHAKGIVDQANGVNSQFKHNVELLNIAWKAGAISSQEYAVAMEYLARTQTTAGRAAEQLKKKSEELNNQALQKYYTDLEHTTEGLERQAAAMEARVTATEEGTAAVYRAKAAELERDLAMTEGSDLTKDYVAQIERQIAALNRAAVAADKLAANKAAELAFRRQIEQLRLLSRAVQDDARTIADALSEGFGKAGQAIGGLTQALGDFGSKQAEITEQFQRGMAEAAAMGSDGFDKMGELIKQKESDTAKATVKMYADMAHAAKGFFAEHSTGYRIMDGLEKAFRIAQVVESTKSFTAQMSQILGLTAAKKAGDQDALSSLIEYVTKAIGLRQAEGQANATAGVANQANGDPYSAFARMAAMAAIMAAIGFAVGGIGGGGGAGGPRGATPDFMNHQGTGTVLGDSSAHSDSIVNALQILRDNSSDDLMYTSAMLTSLRAIESSMKGLASMAARLGLTGQNFQLPSSGSGNTFSVASAGVIIGQHVSGSSEHAVFQGQSVGQLTSNPYAQQFTGVERTHSGTFGSSYSAINYDYASLAEEFTNQIALAATNMRDALAEALNVLTGGNHDIEAIKQALNSLSVDVTTINFQDLKGGDIQTAIEQAFSSIGDQMAQGVLSQLTGPDGLFASDNLDVLTNFQHVGEGAFETVIRVASGVEQANAQLTQWGFTQQQIIKWQDIMNQQGDVSTEIMRQTIVAFETSADGTVSGFGRIIQAADATGEDFVQLYEKLRNLQALLEQSGQSADDLSQAMLDGAGGVERLTRGLEAYADTFPPTERANVMLQQVGRQFTAMGIEMPTTVEGLHALVEHYRSIGDEQTVGRILALVPAWNDAQNAATDAANAARESWLSFQDAVDKYLGRGGGDQRRLNSLIGQFQSGNAAYAGMSPQELLTTLANMDEDTFNKFDKSTKDLIIAILSLAGDIRNNTAAQTSGTFGANDTMAVRDRLLKEFDTKYGPLISGEPDKSSQFGLRSKLLQDQIASWQAKMAEIAARPSSNIGGAFTPGPEYYGLQGAIEGAREQLGGLAGDLARVTVLEAQYGTSIGDQVFDLEKWYAQQQALLAGNNDALAALEKQYQDKRNDIINGGTQDGLSQVRDTLRKWRESLLLSDQSPLTPQQRLDEALRQYQATLSAAQGGDQAAVQNYQQIAQALLQEEESFYGRASGQYQDIFRQIIEDSGGLAGVDPANDPVLGATKDVKASVENQTQALTAKIDQLNQTVTRLQQAVLDAGETQARATRESTERLIDATEAAR